jgi:hypothetical protein
MSYDTFPEPPTPIRHSAMTPPAPPTRSPWKPVKITGITAGGSISIVFLLAMGEGLTGIPLKNVAVYFAWVALIAGLLMIVLMVRASVKTYLTSERHQRGKRAIAALEQKEKHGW